MANRDDVAGRTPPAATASGSERGRLGGAGRGAARRAASTLGVGIVVITTLACSSEEFEPSNGDAGTGGTSGTGGSAKEHEQK